MKRCVDLNKIGIQRSHALKWWHRFIPGHLPVEDKEESWKVLWSFWGHKLAA